jgi:hypothetical protein
MTNSPTIDITAWGETTTCTVEFFSYNNDRLAIRLWCEDGPYGKLTINCPEVHLNEGEVLIKNWAENEPMAQALLDAGWITPTGREVASGFVFPMVATLAGDLLVFYLDTENRN